jgi:hypothetical protein
VERSLVDGTAANGVELTVVPEGAA